MRKSERHIIAARVKSKLDRPVVFIGLMGAGKTRIGRLTAEYLGLEFVDSDDEIEKAAGMSIADIFDCYGETSFREGEARVLKRLLSEEACIIATGGGAVMTPDTAALIWDNSISIWLKATVPVIVERTSRTDKRPLLQVDNPQKVLEDLAARRNPVYQKADLTVESSDDSAEHVLDYVLVALDEFL